MSETVLKTEDIRKLLAAASGDAALLYLCLKTGAPAESCGLSALRQEGALALLRQIGLLEQIPRRIIPGETPPDYTGEDVYRALNDPELKFSDLVNETERRFGHELGTEDLRTLLSITKWIGLSNDVVSILMSYCIERSRNRGSGKMPSFRTIEKEAYRWADSGIDTMEAAIAFVRTENACRSKIGELTEMMGLNGRALTSAETQLLRSWLDMGFDKPEIHLAYERTCMSTGGLSWRYMNAILVKWNELGLHTLEEIQRGDAPAAKPAAGGKKQSAGAQQHGKITDPLMKQAISRRMNSKEGK